MVVMTGPSVSIFLMTGISVSRLLTLDLSWPEMTDWARRALDTPSAGPVPVAVVVCWLC